MSNAEIAFFVVYWVPVGIGFIWLMRKVWRYASARSKEATRLIDEGWIMIGCDFIQGPIMVPPEHVFPPEIAKKWREAAKKNSARSTK